MASADSLLRTDSLSGTDPALSDGSVGSAPSLGLSPGAPCSADSSRSQDKRGRGPLGADGGDDGGMDDRVRTPSVWCSARQEILDSLCDWLVLIGTFVMQG